MQYLIAYAYIIMKSRSQQDVMESKNAHILNNPFCLKCLFQFIDVYNNYNSNAFLLKVVKSNAAFNTITELNGNVS